MRQRPRDHAPGFHHVWVNATGNSAYFLDDVDRMTWVRRLVQTCERFGWRCIVFCQMTTHVHAIVHVPDWSLPEGMRFLNGEYSRDFNARHGRAGYLVRKRYGNRRIEDAADLLGTYAYVVLNPVMEGMCPRAEDWRWSGYATTIGLTNDFPFLDASLVIAEAGGSVDALREFVAEQASARIATAGHVR